MSYKPIYHPDIPSNINFEPDSFVYNDYSIVLLKDLAWNLARLNLSGALDDDITKLPYHDVQIMPSWKASNAIWTEADLPIKKTAFLPPLPYPCTDYATVYSAMKNFVSINSQLKQDKIPLYCDEKVYCIVKEIQFVCPDEFSCIIPCLGTFHTVKALMKCIGKSLMGTGAESVLLETGGYGPSIVDGSIMTAGHYNRALEGLSVLGESMSRLVYKEFFVSEGIENYRTQLETLVEIKKLVNEQDKESTLLFLQQFYSKSETFCDNIKTFIMNRASTHENFRYWIQFLDKMQIVYDMIRADREGNWLLHLDAIQRSLHEFGAWDGVNYFRWASVYLEEMQLLPKLSPIVYENFLKGKSFSIKITGGRFNAVGGDQKLEQTINLASKRSDTFISNSKNKSFLGKWNLVYHEMLSVKQICAEYTDIIDSSFEGWQHNEASPTYTRKMEDQIQNMIYYIENKGSPFTSSCPTILQNFVTKQQMTHDIRNDLLNASQKGKAKYLEFRKEFFIEKSRRLSATIHRSNLKSMKNILLSDSHSQKASCIAKTVSTNDRKIEIARERERGLTTDDLLKYDVVHSPLLYDNGFMTKPNKSQLVIELEKNLSSQDYSYSNQLDSATTVDVMANIRRLPVKDVSTFSWFAKKFFSSIQKYMSIGRCNFVFDIYDDRPSAKDCERM